MENLGAAGMFMDSRMPADAHKRTHHTHTHTSKLGALLVVVWVWSAVHTNTAGPGISKTRACSYVCTVKMSLLR